MKNNEIIFLNYIFALMIFVRLFNFDEFQNSSPMIRIFYYFKAKGKKAAKLIFEMNVIKPK